MSDFPAALGDIASGALTARAIEPGTGEPSTGEPSTAEPAAGDPATRNPTPRTAPAGAIPDHTHETACLNCATPLVGAYCHACGQAAHVHRTLIGFFHDLLHGVFHFEGKIWRTLPMLVWQPGRLTRQYIDGRRARYFSPVALFLFVVFLTFAVFHAIGDDSHIGDAGGRTGATASARMAADIATLEAQRRAAIAAGRDTTDLDGQLAGLRQGLAAIHPTGAFRFAATGARTALDKGAAAAIERAINAMKANPDLALFKLEYSAYKYSWLLIPLSVPFVWLLFPFDRRFRVYDHTVFVTYSLSFMYLLVAVITLGSVFGPQALSGVVSALTLYAPFHMYRQLRETYALGRASALLRTALLGSFAAIVLLVWALTLAVMVFAG